MRSASPGSARRIVMARDGRGSDSTTGTSEVRLPAPGGTATMPSGCGETRVILETGGAVPRFRRMPTAAATYDHATAVADILAGYYRTEMALRRDDTSSSGAQAPSGDRAREEDRFARQAEQPARRACPPPPCRQGRLPARQARRGRAGRPRRWRGARAAQLTRARSSSAAPPLWVWRLAPPSTAQVWSGSASAS